MTPEPTREDDGEYEPGGPAFPGWPEPRPATLTVCRWCYSTNLDGARHGTSVSDGYDGADIVCLWPCNHEVRDRETECGYCNPPTGAPF